MRPATRPCPSRRSSRPPRFTRPLGHLRIRGDTRGSADAREAARAQSRCTGSSPAGPSELGWRRQPGREGASRTFEATTARCRNAWLPRPRAGGLGVRSSWRTEAPNVGEAGHRARRAHWAIRARETCLRPHVHHWYLTYRQLWGALCESRQQAVKKFFPSVSYFPLPPRAHPSAGSPSGSAAPAV